MNFQGSAGRRRLRPLVLGVALAALAAAGCGEKEEPAIHPPTTAATTTPTSPAPGATTTAPANTPTAPVPKTTP